MSLAVIFRPAAHQELEAAVAWYEAQRPGLGREFKAEIKLALQRAAANPELFQKVRGRAHRIRLHRFRPYAIYFATHNGVMSVIAVFHGARDPRALNQRLP